MLRIYTGASLLVALAAGTARVLLTTRSTDSYAYSSDCGLHSVICAGGTAYYWEHAVALTVGVFLLLVVVGYPIIIAGRIGKQRNRRGYLAGIFFSWVGLLYIVLRRPRSGPDLIERAVTDYRGGRGSAG
jgi:hypothetical protein